MQGPRFQADRKLYRSAVADLIAEGGVEVIVAEALALRIENGRICGLQLDIGTLECRALVIATGTFLDARISLVTRWAGGRRGNRFSRTWRPGSRDRSCAGPAQDRHSAAARRPDIDWARLEAQPSDREEWTMSALDDGARVPQLACADCRSRQSHSKLRTRPIVERGHGPSSRSLGCASRRAQSIVRPSSRGGVPVLSRPCARPISRT